MNAKEFLQLEKQVEQMIAFQTIMKGELAKEVKEAKDALAALGGAKKIAQEKKELEEAKVRFEQEKQDTATHFDNVAKGLTTRLDAIVAQEQRFEKLKESALDIEAKANALRQTVQTEQYVWQQEAQKEREKLKQEREELNIRLEKFQSRVDAVAAREALVEKKLALFKEM